MLLPNKLFTYSESIISKFPIVLEKMEHKEYGVTELYIELNDKMIGVSEYMDVLDCLYALGAIEYDREKEVLKYANVK